MRLSDCLLNLECVSVCFKEKKIAKWDYIIALNSAARLLTVYGYEKWVFFSRENSVLCFYFFHYQSPPIDTAVQYDSSPIAPSRNLYERGDIKRLKGRGSNFGCDRRGRDSLSCA